MPFISGPSGSDGITISDTSNEYSEYSARSLSETIPAGTFVEMVDIFEESETISISDSDISNYVDIYKLCDNKVIIFSPGTTQKIILAEYNGSSMLTRCALTIPSTICISNGTGSVCILNETLIVFSSSVNAASSGNTAAKLTLIKVVENTLVIESTTYYMLYSGITMNSYLHIGRLDSNHFIADVIYFDSGSDWTYKRKTTVMTVNGSTIQRGSDMELITDCRSSDSVSFENTKQYTLMSYLHKYNQDTGDTVYSIACFKYVNNSLKLCGTPLNMGDTSGIGYTVNDDMIRFTDRIISESASSSLTISNIRFSDSGCTMIGASYLPPYSNSSYWPENTTFESQASYGCFLNNHVIVGWNISSDKDTTNRNANYVILRTSEYKNKYNVTGGESNICPVLYKEIDTHASTVTSHYGSSFFKINESVVLFYSSFAGINGIVAFTPMIISPVVRATNFRIDGIALTDITPTSGKVIII